MAEAEEEEKTVVKHSNALTEVQDYVVETLNKDPVLKDWGVVVVPEHLLDLDHQVRTALAKQGIAVVVATLKAECQGHDGVQNVWNVSNLEVDVFENAVIRRPLLRKLGKDSGTCSDVVYRIEEVLGGPQAICGFGKFNPYSIDVDEAEGLLVGKARFRCCVRSQVDGVIDPGRHIEIPFALKEEVPSKVSDLDNDLGFVGSEGGAFNGNVWLEFRDGTSYLGVSPYGIETVFNGSETTYKGDGIVLDAGGRAKSLRFPELAEDETVATREWVMEQIGKLVRL